MKHIRKLTVLLCAALLLCLLPVTAYANGPAPSSELELYLINPPEGTVYVDLLVPLQSSDPDYAEPATELAEGIAETAEIVAYAEDGYCSYTFHYEHATPLIRWEEGNATIFADYHVLEGYGTVRVAMLDGQGNIVAVSPELSLETQEMFSYNLGSYTYDYATGEWTAEQAFSGLGVFMYLLLSAVGLFFTCLTEWVIAVPFRLSRGYGRMIIFTNIVSQILMRTLYVLLYGPLIRKYIVMTVLLEVLVYVGEGLFYCLKIKDIPLKRVIAYTAAANTASLLVGLAINWYLF